MSPSTVAARIGGAPISWGVCEAPGWGHELPPTVVLPEMASLGLRATELGPTGYLGADAAAVRSNLDAAGLRLIGGFLPVPMHVDARLDLAAARSAIATLAAAGADVVVLAARSADGGYDHGIRLCDAEWTVLLATLERLQVLAHDHGLTPTLHPHIGTAVEDRAAVLRLLESSDVGLCLDTGHLAIGGTDPVEVLDTYSSRVAHVHFKDVDTAVAARFTRGEASWVEAVRAGLFTPLGAGDLDIAGCVRALGSAGYRGWYVLEQDRALSGPPAPGTGPIDDVRASIAFLTGVPAVAR